MLIYMSSYPRAGSSLLQQIINDYFRQPWTEVDADKRPLEKITGIPENFTNWRYKSEILEQKQSKWKQLWDKINRNTIKFYDIERWIALYDLAAPPYTKNCRYLLPGCLHALTPRNRRRLADESTYYFVKTHWQPYKTYFENEYVIQMVRHPGQVFISYLNHLKDFNGAVKNLDEIIEGKVPYGSWNKWHEDWDRVLETLEERFIRLQFEDVVEFGKIQACEQIKQLIGLNYMCTTERSFEQMRQINPKYYRSGKVDNWSNYYVREQLDMIKKLHGSTMEKLGYDV